MLQEVQTSIANTTESTLETIEAVGTSSRKIIEWRQTIWWHSVSSCIATGNVFWRYNWDWNRESWYIESEDLEITSNYWPIDFVNIWSAIRLPMAWSYECELTWWIWSTQRTETIYIKVWGKTVYTETLNTVTQKTVKFKFNAGKFDKLILWWEFYWSGGETSSAWLYFNPTPTLNIVLL